MKDSKADRGRQAEVERTAPQICGHDAAEIAAFREFLRLRKEYRETRTDEAKAAFLAAIEAASRV